MFPPLSGFTPSPHQFCSLAAIKKKHYKIFACIHDSNFLSDKVRNVISPKIRINVKNIYNGAAFSVCPLKQTTEDHYKCQCFYQAEKWTSMLFGKLGNLLLKVVYKLCNVFQHKKNSQKWSFQKRMSLISTLSSIFQDSLLL